MRNFITIIIVSFFCLNTDFVFFENLSTVLAKESKSKSGKSSENKSKSEKSPENKSKSEKSSKKKSKNDPLKNKVVLNKFDYLKCFVKSFL